MADNFSLGNNGKFGKIDFSKLRSGIKKEEIAGNDAFLNSLFNKFDLSGDGVLSRQEIQKMVEMFNALARNDGELTTSEAKKFQLDGENVGQKNAREVFTFINKLASTTQGVKSVDMNGTTEVIVLEDGTKEEVFEDGSKRTTKPDGSMVYVDKNGVKLEEITVQSGKTVNTEYEDGKKVKETITEADKETVVEYKDGEESRKTVTTKDTVETFYKKDGRDIRIVEDKNTGLIQTFIGGVLAKEENKRTNTTTTYRDGKATTTTKTDNLETVTVKDASGNLITATATQKLDDGRTQVTRTEYDGDNITTTISVDGKNLSQTKVVDGVTYTVNYDGAGNTTVIVQNGESIAALAKKFGCTVEEIIEANPGGKVKGSGSNKYFLVGEEIKIPREVSADSPALQNRKSASDTQADYAAYDARIKAEQAAQAKAKRLEAEQTKQAEQKQQRENEKAQARQLAQQFYDIADHKTGVKSMDAMYEFLKSNINSSNIVDFLDAYTDPNIRQNYSSIIDTIISEWGPGLNKTSRQKKVLYQLINTLCDAAREAGVPEDTIKSLKEAFVTSMNEELDNGAKKTDPTKMEIALDSLLGQIAAAKSGVKATSEEAAMEKVAGDFDSANTQATEEFETAREEDSWIAKLGDTICGWFGCNTVEEMRAKLGDNAAKVEKLIEAANNGDKVEFKRIYKELFGVEFDPNLIAASEKANEDHMNAVIAQSQVEKMNTVLSQINDSMSFDEIASVIKNLYANDPDISPDEVINGILKMYEDAGISAGTEEEKKAILLDFVNSTKAANQSVLDELTATKTIDELAREAELISKSAFGTNDISKMVNEFNQNMIMTDAIGTAAVEIGATVLLQFIPGVGQMAAAKLATSAVNWGVKGVKIAKYATKASKAFNMVSKLQSGTASTSKVINAATRIGTQAVGAGVATAGVGASKNEDVKTVLHRALMNMSFAGAGAASNMIAPKLMQVFGISRQVAVELAEELINAAAAYGITSISGDSYGTQDAFLDIAVGMVMARIGGAGAARGALKGADIDPNMPKPDVDVSRPHDGGIDGIKAPVVETKFNPDGTTTVSAYENGRLVGKAVKDADGNVIKEYKYEYDADGNVKETDVTPQKPIAEEPQSTPKVKTADEEFETVVGLLDNKVNSGDKLSSQEVEQIKTLISNLDDVDKLKDIQFLLDKTNGSVAKTLSKACKSKLDGLNAKSSTVADEPEVKSETSEDAPVEDVVTPKESKKAERKARANKLKELRAKLGNKLARAYVKIEEAIKNMKNAVDFDKISTTIRTKFANFKTEMNELLDRLNAKMATLKQTVKKFFNDTYIDEKVLNTMENVAKQHNAKVLDVSSGSQAFKKGESFVLDIDSYQNTQLCLGGIVTIDLNEPKLCSKLKNLKEGESLIIGSWEGQGNYKIGSNQNGVSRAHLKVTKKDGVLIFEDTSSFGTVASKNVAKPISVADVKSMFKDGKCINTYYLNQVHPGLKLTNEDYKNIAKLMNKSNGKYRKLWEDVCLIDKGRNVDKLAAFAVLLKEHNTLDFYLNLDDRTWSVIVDNICQKSNRSVDALYSYKMNSNHINKALSSNYVNSPQIQKYIDNMTEYLNTQAINKRITVFRGEQYTGSLGLVTLPNGMNAGQALENLVKKGASEKEIQEFVNKYLIGTAVKQERFMSTALSEKFCADWASNGAMSSQGKNPNGAVLWKIDVPNGTRGCFAEDFNIFYNEEYEIILQRGSSLVIKGANFDKKRGLWVIEAKVVQPPVKELPKM